MIITAIWNGGEEKMTKIISEDAFKEQLAKTQLGRKSLEMVSQALRNTPEYHKDTRKGSGSGKSRFVVKPNTLQFNSSYVFTDPKGELLGSLGHALEENGYEIKIHRKGESK